MKDYPRIYSLSTLGLIHHQEFDYLFHPIRTDFNGDSGTGKSMVADLLQLIFVGSDAFESATISNEPRTIDGMVLRTPNKGTDIGYAFVNVEIEEGKYLCIGAYLESISSHTSSFIIQSGYDFLETSKLISFDKPVTREAFLENDHILPLDQLKEKLEQEGLICQSWQRLKTFHALLWNNEILPIDLSENDKILKDYASIIRSFSRGKTLETQKSDSLKEFLFGKEKGKEINAKYKQALNDLKSVSQDYDRNTSEIKTITQKQRELKALKEKKDKSDAEYKQLKIAEYLYWSKQESGLKEALNNLVNRHYKGKATLNALKAFAQSELEARLAKKGKLEGLEQEKENDLVLIKGVFQKLQKALLWLDKLKCTEEELQKHFNTQKEKIKQKQNLDRLVKALKDHSVSELFPLSKWKDSISEGNRFYESTYPALLREIDQKTALLAFSDLNNKESLGYWAFNLKRPLSLEEESAVLYFQDLSRTKPIEKRGNKYLPNVEELFIPLKVAEKTNKGFWINLGGIREFIPFVEKQLLDTADVAVIRSHFQNFSSQLKQEIEDLNKQKLQLEQLKTFVDETENIAELLPLYNIKEDILNFKIISELNISPEEFEAHYTCLKTRSDIEKEHASKQAAYSEAKEAASTNKSTIKGLETELPIIAKFGTDEFTINNIRDIIPEIKVDSLKDDALPIDNEFSDDNLVAELRSFFSRKKEEIPKPEILQESLGRYVTAKDKAIKAEEACLKINPILPTANECEQLTMPYDNSWISAEKDYDANFDFLVKQYIPGDAYKYEQVRDFLELSRNLLPEAFQKADITEDSVIDSIQYYLNSINEKNRQLNSRKLQRIKNLITEVSDTVSAYLDTVRRIDGFFRDKDKQISGGYQVRLERVWSTEYPKTWMDSFIADVENDEFNNRLVDYASLEDKMKVAFHACGGPASVSPTITKLLDPNSYYDLTFSMKAPDGRTNKGSTGQTYAAIALLCIARLSLIGNTNSDKPDPGIRFMPIDEAEGLGSNYDMLYDIAKKNDYQIISLSIGPVGKFKEGEQFVYMLHKNMEESDPVNYTPMAVFSKKDIIQQATKIIDDEG